jgi:hypothetical protein
MPKLQQMLSHQPGDEMLKLQQMMSQRPGDG